MTSIQLPLVSVNPNWRRAQLVGLGLTGVLVLALLTWPAPALRWFWGVVIPVLPAVFLVNPMIWRNICPLATINTALVRPSFWNQRVASSRLPMLWSLGILLLIAMVPARRVLFNQNGPVLAATIISVSGLALLAGWLVPRRGGFCNTICPVLPVEKIYGQAPLIKVGSARCGNCSLCTPSGCIDLSGSKSARQSLGRHNGRNWLLTPFGVFTAAFPGFILGYFSTADGPLTETFHVYTTVVAMMAISCALTVLVVVVLRLKVEVAMTLSGALAAGLYYWFSVPSMLEVMGVQNRLVAMSLKAVMFGVVAAWLLKVIILRRDRVFKSSSI